jgi:ubiquinone/menaquinone biosynthesis C-methylase UbiE
MSIEEAEINKGFSSIYSEYENLNAKNPMSQWKRQRVYEHLEKHLKPRSKILEINAGSCIDAVYLCSKGHKVHATDLSDGFHLYAQEKVEKLFLKDTLTYEQLSFTELHKLTVTEFDHVFSNFAGLNCIEDIESVLSQFEALLNPKGKVTLVILPKIAPWEWLRIRYGISEGFRRFKKNGVKANINGSKVTTYYHSASKIQKILNEKYKTLHLENMGFFMPSVESFSLKRPKAFQFFAKADVKFQKLMPKGVGDYYILTLQLKA